MNVKVHNGQKAEIKNNFDIEVKIQEKENELLIILLIQKLADNGEVNFIDKDGQVNDIEDLTEILVDSQIHDQNMVQISVGWIHKDELKQKNNQDNGIEKDMLEKSDVNNV